MKIVFAEKKDWEWLSEKLGKDEAPVSRCTNESQPSIYILSEIAKTLDTNV